jgi:Uma2 family endonuclease
MVQTKPRYYDQGDKFMYYRSIQEMQEYILLDQKQHHVIQHTKTETGQWLLTEYRGKEATLSFKVIELELSLTNLYEGVDFDSSEE